MKRFKIVDPQELSLYPKNLENRIFGRAKAPGFDDRKPINISNIKRFTIVKSRELSLQPKTDFPGSLGIKPKTNFPGSLGIKPKTNFSITLGINLFWFFDGSFLK